MNNLITPSGQWGCKRPRGHILHHHPWQLQNSEPLPNVVTNRGSTIGTSCCQTRSHQTTKTSQHGQVSFMLRGAPVMAFHFFWPTVPSWTAVNQAALAIKKSLLSTKRYHNRWYSNVHNMPHCTHLQLPKSRNYPSKQNWCGPKRCHLFHI